MTLQRKYFGTDGIRGRTGVWPITAEFALKLGWAVGQVLAQEGQGSVVIGRDTRVSGYMLASALEAGMISSGLDVYLLGTLPTPGVAYLTRAIGAWVGVVVSASHNPYFDNGIKFFGSEGKKLPDGIENEIESLLNSPMTTVDPHEIGSAQVMEDAANRYIEFCKKTFLKGASLHDIKIVVDCANGATYHIAPHVFKELGAQVIVIHDKPDGFNINQDCGSTHLTSLQQAVNAHQADLGIAFDGDGDRLMMVDHKGESVDGDELLFIIAQAAHQAHQLKGGVVGTLMSNLGLEQAFEQMQIPFMRTQVGDKYVMDALQQTGWRLGGESSGHIICLDKTTTGDGIVSALQVLSAMCLARGSLHDLKKGMLKCAQILLNVPVKEGGAQIVQSEQVQSVYQQAVKKLSTRGRVVLRASGTEPLVRVMVEGEDPHQIQLVAENIAEIVKKVESAR